MQKQFEVIPPTMPNYVRFKKPPQSRSEGFKPESETGFDIADFTKEEAIEFAELMRTTFLIHYENRKAARRETEPIRNLIIKTK